MDDIYTPYEYIFLGLRYNQGNKKKFGKIQVLDNSKTVSYYDYKSFKGKIVGGVYKDALFNNEGAKGLDTAKFVRMHENEFDLTEWRALNYAEHTNLARDRLESNLKNKNELKRKMIFLRKIYNDLPYSSRTAFVSYVVNLISIPVGKDEK